MKEFVIPLDKNELTRDTPGQYVVENVVSAKHLIAALENVKSGFSKKGPAFILDHFDTFFSFILSVNKVEFPVLMRAFDRLTKGLESIIYNFENISDFNELDTEAKNENRCIIKMMSYLISNFICMINNQIYNIDDNNMNNIGKKKKAAKKSDNEEEWEAKRKKMFLHIFRLIQFPLQQFWNPPIIEDSFITTITQACYKVLETLKDNTLKELSETIFEILGTLIKKYNYGLTCTIQIIQLMKTYENLAAPMGHGIVYMTTKCKCKGLMEKVIKELDSTEIGESDAKNISLFLETFGSNPDLVLSVLEDIADYLSNENYTIRNSILEIIANVVLKCLTGEHLDDEQKEQRDFCLNLFFDHILDTNAYVRSKTMQIWQRLCCESAVPLKRQGKLLKCAALRLEDKSAIVRKQGLQLLRALLQGNPFAAKMDKEVIETQLKEAQEKLAQIQADVVAKSGPGADVRYELWETNAPLIHSTIKHILADKENEAENYEDMELNDELLEKVRTLMLKGKIKKAVILINNISKRVYNLQEWGEVDSESQEKALLALLYKIFIDSENVKEGDMQKNINDTEKLVNDRHTQVQREKIKSAKLLVTYLQDCYIFAEELENALPLAENLLFSQTVGDAVEACTFLGKAYQFQVKGAEKGFSKALFQVFYRDQNVCKNVADNYKDVYLASEPNQTERQKALSNVSKLLDLLENLDGGQVKALAHLMGLWKKNGDLDNEFLKVLWETYSLKITNSTPIQSRGAILLLTLIAQTDPALIIENLEVLIKIGFGPRSKEDLLISRDTCRALLKIRQVNNQVNAAPIRYSNDHVIFQELTTLMIDNYAVFEENGFVTFAIEAINVIYHLADQPEIIIQKILLELSKLSFKGADLTISGMTLRNYLSIIGHVAIRQMVHLDTSVYKEMKRRNALRDSKKAASAIENLNQTKNKSRRTSNISMVSNRSASHCIRHKEHQNVSVAEDNGEEALEGASADDADAEFIHNYLENDLLNNKHLLHNFIPVVLEICQNPDVFNDEEVQAAVVLALSKFMTISSIFCKQQLRLLVTILEKSPYPGIRSNIIIGLTDLMSRFPNQVEPWTSHIYGRLQDQDVSVRTTCVKMLSNLIMREMIRVKGQVAELALCIMDKNENIRQHTKQFFKDLAAKGNSLYNIMPDIISCLTNPEKNVDVEKFEEVIKFIFSLLQKEKHVDSIIEKICARFKLATIDSQLQNLSFCMSQLQFNTKSIKYIIEFLPQMKDIIHNKDVARAMNNIVDQGLKKAETKDIATELEEKINELFDSPENAETDPDKKAMPPPRVPLKRVRNQKKNTRKRNDSDSEDSDDEKNSRRKSQRNQKNKKKNLSSSDSDSEEEHQKTKKPIGSKGRSAKIDSDSSGSDDEKDKRAAKSRKNLKKERSDSDDERDVPISATKTNRKQKLSAAEKKTGVSPLPKRGKNLDETPSSSRPRRNRK